MESGIVDRSLVNEAMASEIGARNAVSENPCDQRAQQSLCEILVRENRLDEAATALRKAITWLPDVPSLRIQLAFVLARQGQHAAARQTLTQAAEHTIPGSRIHTELVQAAGQPRVEEAVAMPAPHEATAPMGHLKPLVMQPAAAAAARSDVRLGLEDVAPTDTAALVRAGRIAKAQSAEEDLPSAETRVPPAWQARPALPLMTGWRLPTSALVAALLMWQAGAMIFRRIAAHPSDETRFSPGHALTAMLTLPPAPKATPAKPAIVKPVPVKPALTTAAPAPPAPKPTPPEAVTDLPEAALPIVTLAYQDTGDASRQQADQVARQLRQAGMDVSALQSPAPASTSPGITYFYQEDRKAAEAILQKLGDRFGPVQAGAMPHAENLPTPGTIAIHLPAAPP